MISIESLPKLVYYKKLAPSDLGYGFYVLHKDNEQELDQSILMRFIEDSRLATKDPSKSAQYKGFPKVHTGMGPILKLTRLGYMELIERSEKTVVIWYGEIDSVYEMVAR